MVSLHPSCGLDPQPEWVLFNEFVLTTRHFIRTVTEIRPEWLLELAANYYDVSAFTYSEMRRALQDVLDEQTNPKKAARSCGVRRKVTKEESQSKRR